MSHLGIALKRIAEDNGRGQKEIADAAHVAQSQLSRWFSGQQKSISDPDFAAILAAITRDPKQRAEIIAARCRDVKIGPGAELVEITIKGKLDKKGAKAETDDVELSHEHERAIAFIRSQIPLNPALGELMLKYAKMIGMK